MDSEQFTVPTNFSQNDNKQIQDIFNLLKKGDQSVEISSNRDIVLLLGNTGSGKTTLAQYLAGDSNKLLSVDTGHGTGDFIIVDEMDKISANSTITSKTIFPELIIDSETGTYYYDCPGFSDTRSAAHDISATFFIKKIIDSARSVKLVFTISHSSVRRGNDRNDFMLLVRHIVDFIKNISKFKNSIALIVTKVDNLGKWQNYQWNLANDNDIILDIADFIKNVREDLIKQSFLPNPKFNQHFYNQAIEFIDMLLTIHSDGFQKIGIFRRPSEPGELNKSKELIKGRLLLKNLLQNNVQYTTVGKPDFGYTVSTESQLYVHALIEEINKIVTTEFEELEKQILEYFKRQEKLYSLQLMKVQVKFNVVHDMFLKTQKTAISDTITSQEFLKEVIKIIYSLKIDIPLKHLHMISNQDSYVGFLYLISNQSQPKHRSSHLAKGLSKLLQYLNEADKWYTFLQNLYTNLSEYRIQRDIRKYQASSFEQKIKLLNENIQFREIISDPLFHKIINDSNVIAHDEIKNMPLDITKLNALSKVLNFTLGHKSESFCPKRDVLTINGQYIKISDINLHQCPEKVKTVEIFSLNKVFINTSLYNIGDELRLIIISPLWEVLGDTQIVLDGMPGKDIGELRLSDQIYSEGNGVDGKSGLPGGSAGTFLGIGKTFLNEQDLRISAVGGVGGNGQNGADGKDGEDGRGPSLPDTFFLADHMNNWNKQGFHFTENNEYDVKADAGTIGEIYPKVYFTIYGTNGTKGGNGGNGGDGGIGGPGGEITIIGLSEKPNITFTTRKGGFGKKGYGGRGGSGGKNSWSVKVTCDLGTAIYLKGNCKVKIKQPYHGSAPSGKPGSTGINIRGKKNPSEGIQNEKLFLTINRFKKYLRNNLKNSLNEAAMRQFLVDLESNEQIRNNYNTFGLIEELKGLENQYYNLQNEITLMPFYQSLLQRITIHADKVRFKGNLPQEKKLLQYLYAATLSKISSIKNNIEYKLVVDTKAYLDLVEININKLKESYHQVEINEFYTSYKDSLQNKIKEASQFIESQIQGEIEEIFQQIYRNIQNTLVKETNDLIIASHKEKHQLSNKQKELEQLLAMRQVLDGVNIASCFLISLGGLGIMTTSLVEAGIWYTNSFILDEVTLNDIQITQIPDGVKNTITELSQMIKKRKQLLFKQLDDVNKELKSFLDDHSSKTLQKVQEQIGDTKKMIQQEIDEGKDGNFENVDKLKEEINKLLSFEKENCKKEYNSTIIIQKKLKTLNRIQNSLMIAPDIYNKIKEDNGVMEVLSDATTLSNTKLRELRLYYVAIYKIIIPKFRDLETKIKKIKEKIIDNSRFSIEINKWKIQTTINDVYKIICKMTQGFSIEEKLSHSIEKLKEGMTSMINIYDLIEHYHDERQLYAYLAQINSKKNAPLRTADTEINNAIDELDLMIQSNLVLSQYEKAVSAFKQYVFPFAHCYLSEFHLPAMFNLENNISNLSFMAIKNIENLKTKISEFGLSIGNYDKYIHTNVVFSSDNNQSPFFIWPYKTHKEAISKLLDGKEIVFEADITQVHNRNAVKFNMIGLKFKSPSAKIQSELDKNLENFEVTMVHFGNSNYRCGNKVYVIRSEKQTISFHLKKNADGEPLNKNLVYDKIKKNDFMLSPYTMWSIKLTNISYKFNHLRKFKDQEIDLELQGCGQYIDEKINKYVCTENLNDYYSENKMLSEIDNIENYLETSIEDKMNSMARERRHLNNNQRVVVESFQESFTTSGSTSYMKNSFINSIYNIAVRGLESFKYLNPFIYVNSWYDNHINLGHHEFLKQCDSTLLHENLLWSETANESYLFEEETFMPRQYSFINFHSNLLLWDLILKKIMGESQHFGSRVPLPECLKSDINKERKDFASAIAYKYYWDSGNSKIKM